MSQQEFGFDFKFVHKNYDNNIIYVSDWEPNAVSNEGFKHIFDTYFRNNTSLTESPVSFKVGLTIADATHPNQTSSYAQVANVQPNNSLEGYIEQPLSRNDIGFTNLTLDSGDMQITAAIVTFSNTETLGGVTWEPVVSAYLAAIGATETYFISFKALAVTRTLQPGDSLDVIIRQKGRQFIE
jgi:hypothetical protein